MKKNIKFEEALLSLEDIVKKLESGNMPLDKSLEAFEEAVSLIRFCNEKLESAEQKVKILLEGSDGSITDAPFSCTSDET